MRTRAWILLSVLLAVLAAAGCVTPEQLDAALKKERRSFRDTLDTEIAAARNDTRTRLESLGTRIDSLLKKVQSHRAALQSVEKELSALRSRLVELMETEKRDLKSRLEEIKAIQNPDEKVSIDMRYIRRKISLLEEWAQLLCEKKKE